MDDSWVSIFDNGWVFSVHKPEIPPQFPPLVLLHGLSGNENSLPPLVSKFNQARWILSPRGLESAPDNGYAWAHEKSRNMSDFKTSLNAFFPELKNLRSLLGIDSREIDLMGFSQGAAFASLLLVAFPEMVRRTALISGFIPQLDPEIVPALDDHLVMISHGTRDEIVPFSDAVHAAELMRSFGAMVTFCESNTRHKIGAYCLSQLETFFD